MTATPPPERALSINGGPPRAQGLAQLEAALGAPIPDGDYWYDPVCGACGVIGGPCTGFLPPGLDLAEPLPADASGTGSGVIVNGRELHPLDVVGLNQVLICVGSLCMPGRWTIDAMGNLGPEDGAPLVNLVQVSRVAATHGMGGGDNFWSTRWSAGNHSGGAGYVRFADGSSATYGM